MIAALPVALLLCISGCGGDSDAETQANEGSGQSAAVKSSATTPSSKASAKQDTAQGKDNGSTGSAKAKAGSESTQGKQAPPISVPKGAREPEPTPQQRANATVASIALEGPAFPPSSETAAALPAAYTCKGKNVSPPLRWSGVPEGTQELVLFVMDLVPVEGTLFFDWAVAGLDPSLTSLEEGRLPKGAILGRNGFGKNGYGICPKEAQATYIFALYALPQRLNAKPGFDPLSLRKEVMDVSGNVGLLAAGYGG